VLRSPIIPRACRLSISASSITNVLNWALADNPLRRSGIDDLMESGPFNKRQPVNHKTGRDAHVHLHGRFGEVTASRTV
jgi:hypothetical protein